MSMSGRATVCEPQWAGVDDWAVDEQLAELGRVLGKRIGALTAAVAGVWGGLVAANRARLRRVRHGISAGRPQLDRHILR